MYNGNGMKNQKMLPRCRGGFSLLELMIGCAITAVIMLGIFSTVISCSQLRQLNLEKAMARNAVAQTLSGLRGMVGIEDAYNRFGGNGSMETFSARNVPDPSPNEQAGRVIVWRRKDSLTNFIPPQPDPASLLLLNQDELQEAQTSFTTNFPNSMDSTAYATGTTWNDYLDINGDGIVDGSDDPQLMPVTVRIRWKRNSGLVTDYYSTIIGKR